MLLNTSDTGKGRARRQTGTRWEADVDLLRDSASVWLFGDDAVFQNIGSADACAEQRYCIHTHVEHRLS